MELKDCNIGDIVIINGDKATIKHKDLGTITVQFEDCPHYSKWYDSKEVELCENQSTNQES